jgi:hypothetical protein
LSFRSSLPGMGRYRLFAFPSAGGVESRSAKGKAKMG